MQKTATSDVSVEKGDVFRLQDAWVYQVSVLADKIARRVTQVVAEAGGLSLSQWRVLAAVADKPGRTATDVVEVTPMDKVLVSRAVRALVERGLLRREASQQDGRVSHLALTAPGQALYHRLIKALGSTGAHGAGCLSQDQEQRLAQQLSELIASYDRFPGLGT